MTEYWVVGGEYMDTRFEEMAGGGAEQRIGPFASYPEAFAEWQHRAWATVDNANARYRIEEAGSAAPTRFWVVGGAYTDTSFRQVGPDGERWFGPFDSYEAAKAEWQRHAWASVDDALSRYRIEKRTGDPRQGG